MFKAISGKFHLSEKKKKKKKKKSGAGEWGRWNNYTGF